MAVDIGIIVRPFSGEFGLEGASPVGVVIGGGEGRRGGVGGLEILIGSATLPEFLDVLRDEVYIRNIGMPDPAAVSCRPCVEMGRTAETPCAASKLFAPQVSEPEAPSIDKARDEKDPARTFPCPEKDVLVGDGGCMIAI